MDPWNTSTFKLGIIGGGQLGKMLTLSASNWDVATYVMDPSYNCPASRTCTRFILGDFNNYDDVYFFGKNMDVITIEIEHVNTDALLQLKKEGKHVYPDPDVLNIIKDKGLQKVFYTEHQIPTSPFKLYENAQAAKAGIDKGEITFPFVQKTRKEGYDGKGVKVIRSVEDELFDVASLIEEKVKIVKEISVIVAQNKRGEQRSFPPVEMVFNPEANLVEYLICPTGLTNEQEAKAVTISRDVVDKLGCPGIFAVELFLDDKGDILVNEIAPRPHNSGHHTIESAYTSQYEQHLRAVLNLPLGATDMKIPSVMVNLLGDPNHSGSVKYEGMTESMEVEGVKVHIYGKKETRPYRKMGHATILDTDIDRAKEKAKFVQKTLKIIS